LKPKESIMARKQPKTPVITEDTKVPAEKKAPSKLTENQSFSDEQYANDQMDRLIFAIESFKNGDTSVRLTKERDDKFAVLSEAYNDMVDLVGGVNTEVSRISRVAGIEGNLSAKASNKGAAGVWLEVINNINVLIESIANPTIEVGRILDNISKGNLSEKFQLTVTGDFKVMSETINRSLDSLNVFADEVTRVAKEVGTDGVLGGKANVPNVGGTWKTLTDNVNTLAANLTGQVREISAITTAVSKGDLTQKITIDAKGEVDDLKTTINSMVDNLNSFSQEVSRVAKEIGTDGVLGGQAKIEGIAGAWRELTDNVNTMAANLTNQVREISVIAKATSNGDLTQTVNEIGKGGEVLDLARTINNMNIQLGTFATEVTRVAQEIGTEGQLGGQAKVEGVRGTWKELTDNVNIMAANLTSQVREIAIVTSATAKGNLSLLITEDGKAGEVLDLAKTINAMNAQLGVFASEVNRVAHEIGTEGILGGQAEIDNVSGTWKNLTDNVNVMAANLTSQVREISIVATATSNGDLSQKITQQGKAGEVLELAVTINAMNEQLGIFASEVTRVSREIGTEGMLGGQADVENVSGTWKDLTDNVNIMATNLTRQVREISVIAKATSNGDLTQTVNEIGKGGEVLDLARTINNMNIQLGTFATEVTRVAQEIGTEGQLGGQAKVEGVRGTWKELTNNVNIMASNLTSQVREIAIVTSATAKGNLSLLITEDGKAGEVLTLAKTINAMNAQLGVFASEVTRVAYEIGTEGILGGQAEIDNVSGTWKSLTDNVNVMAANLTSQVREISIVATASSNEDFSQQIIQQGKSGEVLELAITLNTMNAALNSMTSNLRAISTENESEKWMKTGQSGLNDHMRGEQAVHTIARSVITYLSKYVGAKLGVIYLMNDDATKLNLTGTYAYTKRKGLTTTLKIGEGLVGQAAFEQETILLTDVPKDYVTISSGLGDKTPQNILVSPFILEGKVIGVLELGSFKPFTDRAIDLVKVVGENIAVSINSAKDRERMKDLLDNAQVQAQDLQVQQDALKQLNEDLEEQTNSLKDSEQKLQVQAEELTVTNEELEEQSNSLKDSEQKLQVQAEELTVSNEELEEKAKELEGQKTDIVRQNAAIVVSKNELEEKARELTLASKYKSEFLSNMSHELRTPLNSLLILSSDLASNEKGNLTPDQVKDAQVIRDGGDDLLNLINDILDLSKVEAGKLTIQLEDVRIANLIRVFKNNFEPVAKTNKIEFRIEESANLVSIIKSDSQRIEQIVKNLLSNAFKFTSKGSVTIKFHEPKPETKFGSSGLSLSKTIGISVIDTGIGIPKDKQKAIFEAFQQAEGGTSRKYGGTGLGLTISRELTKLLGGELHLSSTAGKGSTFTLYIPIEYAAATTEKEIVNAIGTTTTELEAVVTPDSGNNAYIERTPVKYAEEYVLDDRNDLALDSNVVLIIEDDKAFAISLLKLTRKKGYKCIVTNFGKEGIDFARKYRPSGIILDMNLPDIDGLKVLDNLKFDLDTRHIPIHVVSAHNSVIDSLKKGAVGYLKKPATRQDINGVFDAFERLQADQVRSLLIIEDDQVSRDAIKRLLKNKAVTIKEAATAKAALTLLKKETFDCVVLDLNLPDMSGFELLKQISIDKKIETMPVVIYTGKDLEEQEYNELQKYAKSIVVKGANSPERLFDEVSLFLHSVEKALSQQQKKIIQLLHDPELVLKGKKILLADDDVRNTYALSNVLSKSGLEIILADNGKTAIEKLKTEKNIDLVLMDIMMPVMDGYEATKIIRTMAEYKKIPVIALTAKAMPEDKAKCIEAGANDYLTKPINMNVLLNMMRIWLFERQ
jgi:CheY-like chemotaxis protein/methyl-accepting chemotaxis protein